MVGAGRGLKKKSLHVERTHLSQNSADPSRVRPLPVFLVSFLVSSSMKSVSTRVVHSEKPIRPAYEYRISLTGNARGPYCERVNRFDGGGYGCERKGVNVSTNYKTSRPVAPS